MINTFTNTGQKDLLGATQNFRRSLFDKRQQLFLKFLSFPGEVRCVCQKIIFETYVSKIAVRRQIILETYVPRIFHILWTVRKCASTSVSCGNLIVWPDFWKAAIYVLSFWASLRQAVMLVASDRLSRQFLKRSAQIHTHTHACFSDLMLAAHIQNSMTSQQYMQTHRHTHKHSHSACSSVCESFGLALSRLTHSSTTCLIRSLRPFPISASAFSAASAPWRVRNFGSLVRRISIMSFIMYSLTKSTAIPIQTDTCTHAHEHTRVHQIGS